MKTLIAAAVLLASTSAFASSAAKWDCGNGTQVSSNRGEMALVFRYGPYAKDFPIELKSSRHLTWNFQGSKDEVRVNGKLCKRTN